MPSYPGQLKYVRKNLYSVVFFLDLSTQKDQEILSTVFSFIQNTVPIRFGYIPIVTQDAKSPGTVCHQLPHIFSKFDCTRYL